MPWERVVRVMEQSGVYTCITRSGARVRLRALPPEGEPAPSTLETAEKIRDACGLDELYFELRPSETVVLGSEYGVMLKAVNSGFSLFVRTGAEESEVIFGFEMEERGIYNE